MVVESVTLKITFTYSVVPRIGKDRSDIQLPIIVMFFNVQNLKTETIIN